MSRFTGGWVKLYREVLEKDLHQNLILWGLWNYLLVIAVYKDSQIIWAGKQRVLKPGSCVIGLNDIAKMWGVSPRTISKWLNYLHDTGRIVRESCALGTVVTICNWSLYQTSEEEPCAPSVELPAHALRTNCALTAREVALSEEVKKERNKERKKLLPGIRVEYPEEFDQLWLKYGRKGDKKASFLQFKALHLSESDLVNLNQAIENYQRANPEFKFRKDLERFLKTDWREFLTPLTNGHALRQVNGPNWEEIWGKVEENEQRTFSKSDKSID